MLTAEAQRTFTALKTVAINTTNVGELEFEYNNSQYPEFEDSSIIAACWKDTGKDLTDEELDTLNEDSDFVYESLQEYIY